MADLKILTGQVLHELLVRYMPLRHEHPKGVCLVVDADRTLCSEDTGRLVGGKLGINSSIRHVFEQSGYQDEAFTDVSVLWSDIHKDVYLYELESVANSIQLRACWTVILNMVAEQIPILVLTAGIPQIWRCILFNAGHTNIPVIGGCHGDLDEYLVSARVKGDIVRVLKEFGWRVVAAGDSCVDLPMLSAADVAMFVPDHKGSPELLRQLAFVPSIRHLLVDGQRFDNLPTCTAMEAAEMILRGGFWNVD